MNKLNQELQQARTLHNALQAQADKVNIKVINKTKEKQSFRSSVRNCIYCACFPPVILLFPSLCVLFLFPLLCFLLRIFVPKFKDISSLTLWPCLLPVSLSCSLCFPPLFYSLLHSSLLLPPLGFSPMERLSYEGNDRTAMLEGVECFKYRWVNPFDVWKAGHEACQQEVKRGE